MLVPRTANCTWYMYWNEVALLNDMIHVLKWGSIIDWVWCVLSDTMCNLWVRTWSKSCEWVTLLSLTVMMMMMMMMMMMCVLVVDWWTTAADCEARWWRWVTWHHHHHHHHHHHVCQCSDWCSALNTTVPVYTWQQLLINYRVDQ